MRSRCLEPIAWLSEPGRRTTQLSSGGGRVSHKHQKAYVPPPSAAAPSSAFATRGNRRRASAWNHASTSGGTSAPVAGDLERPVGVREPTPRRRNQSDERIRNK